MHKTTGVRDPAAAFPLPRLRDDANDRRAANRAVAVSAIGLAATGIIELLLAIVTGSVGLLICRQLAARCRDPGHRSWGEDVHSGA
jgi:hypothetical protein